MKYLIFILLLCVSFTCNNGCLSQGISLNQKNNTDTIETAVLSENWKKADKFFQNYASKTGFNGAVLISQHDTVVYKNAFGYADIKAKTSLSTNSTFQLASVSKQFTAAAIMLLQQRGELKYEDDLTKYLPDFPYQNITIRNLLNHRSGLCNYIYFCEKHWKNENEPMSNTQVLSFFKAIKPAPYLQPNRKYNYSNTGYMILAAVVEKVSGMKFADFMSKEFFIPLGMKSTYIYQFDKKYDTLNTTLGYETKQKRAQINYIDGVVGDKGVYSTVEDLFLWDQSLYSGAVLSEKTVEEAFLPGNKDLKTKNYGFGWRLITNKEGDRIVYHRGWWHGYKSLLLRNIDKHDAIIMLSNVASSSFVNIQSIEDIIKVDNYQELIAAEEEE
ncbi:MAG: serine hydrolase domain-containing protein [Bacteroidota bacterium]